MTLSFPPRQHLAQLPTPLQPLDRLSNELGGPRIWVKRDDLTGSVLSGNKVRKLEFAIGKALEQGCDTLITCGGIQSNHCRATVVAGIQSGLKSHLILRGEAPTETPEGNLFLECLAGAEISYYPGDEFSSRLDEIYEGIAEGYACQGHKAYAVPMGASDEVGMWGYINCARELIDDCATAGIAAEHIVTATGSGGTQAGLIVGNAAYELGAQIWSVNVCDDEETFVNKVKGDIQTWKKVYNQPVDVDDLAINVLDGYVGPGYAMATPEIFALIKKLARLEGIFLDPVYTAKAFLGMLAEIEKGRFDGAENIIFIHTGGLYGLFAQREEALR